MTSTALTESKKKLPILASASKSSTKLSNINTKNKIAEAAYYKAESRGFEPGREMQDWLEAESELMQ